jgi:hypothetical protein
MRDWRMGGGGGMVLCEKEREREQEKGGERLQHFGKRFTKFFFFIT